MERGGACLTTIPGAQAGSRPAPLHPHTNRRDTYSLD
nr:MAG TPA: hypothetical protein [Caudoviricetes sp.]